LGSFNRLAIHAQRALLAVNKKASIWERMDVAPVYLEASMELTHAADRERFDQAAKLLFISLQESKTLNWEIRKALQDRKTALSDSKADLAWSVMTGSASA
jgi:hypothetical protein